MSKLLAFFLLLGWGYITFHVLGFVIPAIILFLVYEEWFTEIPKSLLKKILE